MLLAVRFQPLAAVSCLKVQCRNGDPAAYLAGDRAGSFACTVLSIFGFDGYEPSKGGCRQLPIAIGPLYVYPDIEMHLLPPAVIQGSNMSKSRCRALSPPPARFAFFNRIVVSLASSDSSSLLTPLLYTIGHPSSSDQVHAPSMQTIR